MQWRPRSAPGARAPTEALSRYPQDCQGAGAVELVQDDARNEDLVQADGRHDESSTALRGKRRACSA